MNLLSLVEVDDSSEVHVANQAAIASKLAPTMDLWCERDPCGSELARDEASQASEDCARAFVNRFPRAPVANSITA
ncbi:hypothetical protein D3C87_2051620 [compost metagenome]